MRLRILPCFRALRPGWALAVAIGVSGCERESITTDPLVFVVITPANPTVVVSDTVRIRATSSIGSPCDCRWSSSNVAIATVDPAGLVRALAPGRAVVTAAHTRFPEATASALIEVQAP